MWLVPPGDALVQVRASGRGVRCLPGHDVQVDQRVVDDAGMPTLISPAERAAAVRRLRAAGCVFAEDEADALIGVAHDAAHLAVLVGHRAKGLPLEQVVGSADFCGIRVSLRPGVFVPRHRSALLVRLAAAGVAAGATVVDLCCGSGALGAAVAARVPGVALHAADVDAVAVACARDNVARFGGRVYTGDLFAALPGDLSGRVDVLLANVPYVPTGEIGLLPAEARLYEPTTALDGGPDGLDLARRVAAGAPAWLAPGGRVLMETTARQAPAARAALADAGLTPQIVTDDDLEATAVVGTAAGGTTRAGRTPPGTDGTGVRP
jgi:release factor glutamine methyltransferase